MEKGTYEIISNRKIAAAGIWKMVLRCTDGSFREPRAGQFVNLALPGQYLRRPISICDWDCGSETLTLVYRIAGAGTREMSSFSAGTRLDLLCGLGNGFAPEGRRPLLVGGGVGLPPMLALARTCLNLGLSPTVVAGFSGVDAAILGEEFSELGLNLHIATMDGSIGTRGTVMEVIKTLEYDSVCACGPKPMLKALCALEAPVQLSVEERMGCGYGVCMGCSCATVAGYRRVCKDGPVFRKEELLW